MRGSAGSSRRQAHRAGRCSQRTADDGVGEPWRLSAQPVGAPLGARSAAPSSLVGESIDQQLFALPRPAAARRPERPDLILRNADSPHLRNDARGREHHLVDRPHREQPDERRQRPAGHHVQLLGLARGRAVVAARCIHPPHPGRRKAASRQERRLQGEHQLPPLRRERKPGNRPADRVPRGHPENARPSRSRTRGVRETWSSRTMATAFRS